MEDNYIVMGMEDGSEQEFELLESTVVNGIHYILVADAVPEEEDGDGECFILKDVSDPDDEEAVYEEVDDEAEYDAVMDVFAEMLSGEIDIER